MMQKTGYSECTWQPYTFGIAGLYTAVRPPVALGVAMNSRRTQPRRFKTHGTELGAEAARGAALDARGRLHDALKLAAGLISGSLGVLSDAAHSGLDLAGSGITFFSVRVSDKPADEDHTYGHGKVENLSAFFEAGLMALSCAWIIWEAIQRIRTTPSNCATPCGRCWCC